MSEKKESMPPVKYTEEPKVITKIKNFLDIKRNKEKPLVFLVCTLQLLYLCFGI
jgi:hypothetical protein